MYTSNKEYRQIVRDFCKMNCPKIDMEDLDEETMDELLYDALASKKTMDFIYEKTKDHPLWQGMYDKSAAKFFSENREIGLSVLFCYDFFWDFKHCWDFYLKSLEEETIQKFDENNEFYTSLNSKL